MDYVIFKLARDRLVLANGVTIGRTNELLTLPLGRHAITLGDPALAHRMWEVILTGKTSSANPHVLDLSTHGEGEGPDEELEG